MIFLLIGESLLSFSSSGDVRFTQYVEIVKNIRIDLFNKGVIIALLISSGALFSIWLYSKDRISKQILSIILIGILVADLWVINNEFLSLKSSKSMGNQFIQTQDVKYIKNDNSKFRIFPADEINSNKFGYWNIESIGGYRAVKLRNYQDLMDVGGFRRPEILNMLNVKYLITRKKVKNTSFKQVSGINNLYENLDVLPRAWFVSKIKNVNDQEQSLSKVMDISFNPKNTAIIVKYDGPELSSSSDGIIKIKSFSPNRISLKAETKGGELLVLSEVFYQPGWKCTVDDKLVPIYQTNHILRSVYVPGGSHKVEFYYDSSDWKMAKVFSRFTFFSSILFLGLILYRENKNKILFIFDEPTTGLHFDDINYLIKSLFLLIENGHSVIVVEHNLDMIKCADYIIDLGPNAGTEGGELVASGTPEEIVKINKSHTGKFLKNKLI